MSFVVPELPLQDAGLVFAVLTGAILAAPLIARRLRLPELIVLLALGFAVGPTGTGILERTGTVGTLGAAGLLYLMFVAGLELDLEDFVANRRDSLVFGALTFVLPMVLGTATSLALGYALLPAVLLASCWASHTLLTYPTFQRAGTAGHRVVATAVGATIITDTAALLVLAVVARAHQGALTPVFWATLLPSIAVLGVGAMRGLPHLARRFFSGPGQDRELRFVFVLVCLFVISSLAQLAGVEAIVGAFLAGLALNRAVPNGGALMERVDFVGRALFVPLFLLATGMLVDLRVLADLRTLGVGAAFVVVAMGSKLLAAAAGGRWLGYGRVEVGALFALSNTQAAATLAAVVVGLRVGLIDEEVVNAVLLVILATSVVSSAVATRCAPRLATPRRARALGEVVVVPVANPDTAPRLLRLASAFARADGGLVVPVVVAPPETDATRLDALRHLEQRVQVMAQSAGAEARSLLRIDATPQLGISHTVVEAGGSLLVLGWNGASSRRGVRFGGVIDGVLERTRLPTLVTYEGSRPPARVLLVVDASVLVPGGRHVLELAQRTVVHLHRDADLPVTVVTNEDHGQLRRWTRDRLGGAPVVDARRRSVLVRELATSDDLVVLPTLGDEGHLRAVTSRVLRAVPAGGSLLVAIAEPVPEEAAAPPDLERPGRADEPGEEAVRHPAG